MNAYFKLITAALGFAVAASSIGDVSAKTNTAKTNTVKPHAAAAKTIAHTPNRLHVGKRVVTHIKIARRAPKVLKVVKTLGTRTIVAAKPVVKKVLVKKVLVKKAFGAKKIFVAKSLIKKSLASKRFTKKVFVKHGVAKKVFAKKTLTKKILAKRTFRGKTIAHTSTKRPLMQKQAMLHRASVKKSVVR